MTTYYVRTDGSDSNSGTTDTSTGAWATIQHALSTVVAGDTAIIDNGTWSIANGNLSTGGLTFSTAGTSATPITIKAANTRMAIIDGSGLAASTHCLNVTGTSPTTGLYLVLDGLVFQNSANGNNLRLYNCAHVTVQNCGLYGAFEQGFLTSHVSSVTVQDCEAAFNGVGTGTHGFYFSNSSDSCVLRLCDSWANANNGLHMNGDNSSQTPVGNGLITNILVEKCKFYGNGALGINGDGVQGSMFRNNLVWGNGVGQYGMKLYMQDASAGPGGNIIINNTIISSGSCIAIQNSESAAGTNKLYNNVLITTGNGCIRLDDLPDRTNTVLDYNAGFAVGGDWIDDTASAGSYKTLAGWQAASAGYSLGEQDIHSLVAASAAALFLNGAANDYRLVSGSAAIDAGTSSSAPVDDLLGNNRPQGGSIDMGCYEYVTPSRPLALLASGQYLVPVS